jgi:hypothetical protein
MLGKSALSLLFLGIIAVILALQYRQIPTSSHNEVSVILITQRALSEEEQVVRRRALENLENKSNLTQQDIQKEDEIISKKIHSDEFFFLDGGIRYKITHDWDYDYWLAENSSSYYEYYLSDPSTHATILGFAVNTTFDNVKLFMHTLQATRYVGRLIIVIHKNAEAKVIMYLKSLGVDIKYMHDIQCNHTLSNYQRPCIKLYPSIISEWSYIPVIRDHLLDCYQRKECIESVLVVDISKTFFQGDPFGAGSRIIDKLELYEENSHVDVKRSLIRERILRCTGFDIRNRPMISADSFAGPVMMVISFLEHVHEIMRDWMNNTDCVSYYHRDDDLKALFNFIRLNNTVPLHVNVTYFSHRTGIVNTVGYDGARIFQSHIHFQQFRGYSFDEAMKIPFEGSNGSRWIGNDYLLIDDEGYFINTDFERSYVVQQFSHLSYSK